MTWSRSSRQMQSSDVQAFEDTDPEGGQLGEGKVPRPPAFARAGAQ